MCITPHPFPLLFTFGNVQQCTHETFSEQTALRSFLSWCFNFNRSIHPCLSISYECDSKSMYMLMMVVLDRHFVQVPCLKMSHCRFFTLLPITSDFLLTLYFLFPCPLCCLYKSYGTCHWPGNLVFHWRCTRQPAHVFFLTRKTQAGMLYIPVSCSIYQFDPGLSELEKCYKVYLDYDNNESFFW